MSLKCARTSKPAVCVIMGLGFAIASCGDSGKGGGGAGATGGSASGAAGSTSAGVGGKGTAGSGTGGAGTGGSSTAGSSSGGTGGDNTACAAAPYEHTFGFGALFEGWTISSFSTPSLVPMEGTGGTPGGSGGISGNDAGGEGGDSPGGTGGGPTGTIMELDTSDGAPDSPNGSLKLTIPFDGPAQLLLLGQIYNTNLNFAGTLVTAQIKLDSGLSVGPSDTGTANLVLKSTDGFIYSQGPAVVLDPSAGWATLTLDPDAPGADALFAGYSACQIREIDIEIHTGNTGSYREAVVHIDAVAVTPKP